MCQIAVLLKGDKYDYELMKQSVGNNWTIGKRGNTTVWIHGEIDNWQQLAKDNLLIADNAAEYIAWHLDTGKPIDSIFRGEKMFTYSEKGTTYISTDIQTVKNIIVTSELLQCELTDLLSNHVGNL